MGENNIFSNSTSSTGKEGCQCIDASSTLASLTERSCTTRDGQEGILLSTTSVTCVPHSFGSSSCLLHDLTEDPKCELTSSSGPDVPSYCIRPWCYVDAMECMGASEERVYRSTYFPAGSGVELFYSYSTCGASADEWMENPHHVLGEITMRATTAAFYLLPFVYKKRDDGTIPTVPGSEYFNNSVPYKGVHIDYVKSLQGVADGDFKVDWIHGSRASKRLHPSSPGTASIQDVADGLVDLAVGPFWITPSRLKTTAFTMPIGHDKTVMVIPQPGTSNTLSEQVQKVFGPFSWGVWGLILATILLTALLSVWISGKAARRSRQSGHSRRAVYTRLAVDECLQKGMFFCSAGIDQDNGANLSHKFLMFGFGFFILIVVSAYVANLAAFLTRNSFSHVGSFEDAVAQGYKICAHPALKDDLELAHPDADFVFNQDGKEMYGLVDDWDAKKCEVMAVGQLDSLGDIKLMNLFCERKLVFTESLVIENPVGFPIRSDLAPGFSYWMSQAEKYHSVTVESSLELWNKEYRRKPNCNVILSEQSDGDESEYTEITVPNLIFPVMFFLGFAILAVILQLYQKCTKKENPNLRQLMGRYSSLNFSAGATRNDGRSPYSIKEDEEECSLARIQSTPGKMQHGNVHEDISSEKMCTINENDSTCRTVSFRLDVNEGNNSAEDPQPSARKTWH